MYRKEYDQAARGPAQEKSTNPIYLKLGIPEPAGQDVSASGHSPSTSMRVELIELTEKERSAGEQPIVTPTSAFNRAREDTGRYSEYALQLVQKVDKEGSGVETELRIRSPAIRKALQTILASYAYLNLMSNPIVIQKPYDALFHYREELIAYTTAAERTCEESCHMKVLTEKFFSLYLNPIEKIYMEEIPKGRVRFSLLWTLFRAEDDIIVETEYYREIHRVVHCEEKTDKDDTTYFQIHTWRWGYNAQKFGPTAEIINIPKFSSTRRIEQLPCFPVKFLAAKEQEDLYKEMVGRGHRWRNLLKPAFRQYDGATWQAGPKQSPSMSDLVISFIQGRIVLDLQSHVEQNPTLIDRVIGSNGYNLENQSTTNNETWDYLFAPAARYGSFGRLKLDSRAGDGKKVILNRVQCFEDNDEYVMRDEEAWLSPARVRGFSLSEKKWAFFLVDKVTDISFQEESFHALEIKWDTKQMMRALVEMHQETASKFDDLVKGKGKGLVICLEGPPGSGKTLTAESISELTHRPLYAISTSELTTDTFYAEPNLRMIFARAMRWNAIVLLDEADVFLTKRTADDLQRNAFVTLFLRLLEYFQGVMFLTTNRVEEFDPAFSSRIHLNVRFERPTALVRAAIWRNFLRDNEACRDWDDLCFERLGREFDINGRQIKNLVSTSLAIAAYRKESLSENLLRLVHTCNFTG